MTPRTADTREPGLKRGARQHLFPYALTERPLNDAVFMMKNYWMVNCVLMDLLLIKH